MKISILYYSKTGKTKQMAEVIRQGICSVCDADVRLFSIDEADFDFVSQSCAVIFGTPTYYANTCWQIKKWFDESHSVSLGGKLGAVFATADYAQGGADVALMNLIGHLMVKGMVIYSGGSAYGQPFIHLGAVALKDNFEQSKPMFKKFGERIAFKAEELFGQKENE